MLDNLQTSYPEISLRLYLQATQVINNLDVKLADLSYDFVENALTIFQEELGDFEEKKAAIKLIVSTLSHLSHFDADSYDTLSSNAKQCCQKLLKKPDQAETLSLCNHLFTNPTYTSTENLIKNFDKWLRIANGKIAIGMKLKLFIIQLNKYIYFYQTNLIHVDYVNEIVQQINSQITSARSEGKFDEIKDHIGYYEKTIDSIRAKQTKPEFETKFAEIQIS